MESELLTQITALAEKLEPAEKRLLIRHLSNSMLCFPPLEITPGRKWSEIAGIVPYPMFGEDAQEWVTRTRRESDEHRERVLRGAE